MRRPLASVMSSRYPNNAHFHPSILVRAYERSDKIFVFSCPFLGLSKHVLYLQFVVKKATETTETLQELSSFRRLVCDEFKFGAEFSIINRKPFRQ